MQLLLRNKKIAVYATLLGVFWPFCQALAQERTYSVDVSNIKAVELKDFSKMGGENATGENIHVNQDYITRNGVPVIPVTGEFHFSRYPAAYWDESLKKIKASGINTVATYIFWNIHEEEEGKYNFSGNRDIRKFVELCEKNKLELIVRIGPFCHGEIRNGGLPDWLLGKPLSVRSNDPLYLHYVELLYQQVGKQLAGLYFKDGGPIIGIQLENEYQHSASPWGLTYPGQPADITVADRDRSITQEGVGISRVKNPYAELGNDHMRVLKALAQKAGIMVPVYTATGWGNAAGIPEETLPVTAAYAYPNWTKQKELSDFYLYKDLHIQPDYAPVRYNPREYPVFPAEIGAGIMDNYVRRPVVPAESLDALINRCLGSGANGIGYYMFHGGSTPVGQHYFFSDEAFGYPKISYDFQAPIGEFGDIRPSYQRLKLLHFFINDFASQLAPMSTVLPGSSASIKPDNATALRYAVRSNGNSGFLFINNFQDNVAMADQNNISFSVKTLANTIRIPHSGGFDLKSSENLILPFNLDVNGCSMRYATAQLLCKSISPAKAYYVFFYPDGSKPEFCFGDGSGMKVISNGKITKQNNSVYFNLLVAGNAEFTVTSAAGKSTTVLVIPKETALRGFCQDIAGSKHLLFVNGVSLNEGKSGIALIGKDNNFDFSIFPEIELKPRIANGVITPVKDKLFTTYHVSLPAFVLKPETIMSGTQKMVVALPEKMPENLNDLFLYLDYTGDTAMGFLHGELACDNFYNGKPWLIGLKQFIGKDKQFGFYFRPLMHDAPYLVDLSEEVTAELKGLKQLLRVNQVKFIPEYKSVIEFDK